MLQTLRTVGKNRWVMGILFGVTAVSMGLFGLPSLIHGDQNVAHIGKIAISPNQLDSVFSTELMDASREAGKIITRSEGMQMGLLMRALAKITTRAQFQQKADDMGLVVNDESLLRAVQQEKAFLDDKGKFSRAQFDMAIRQSGLSEKSYLDLVRGDLAQQQIVRLFTSGAQLPVSVQADLARYGNETRDASFITLTHNLAVLDKNAATDAILADYYEKNKEKFRTPEYRTITVLSLGIADLAKSITPTEDQIKAEYDRAIDQFKTDERRAFVQVLAPDEQTAIKIRTKAQKEGSLEKAALAIDGKLALQTFPLSGRDGLTPELADAVFNTAQDKIADVVKSAFGWHVIKVTDVQKAGQKPLADARSQIIESLKKQQAGEQLFDAGANLEDNVNNGMALDKAGAAWNITPVTITAIDSNGTPKTGGKPPARTPDLPQILQEAFKLGAQETSALIESPSGGYMIIRVDQIEETKVPPLQDIRDSVKNAWMTEEKARVNSKRVDALIERLNKGTKLADIAKETGTSITQVKAIKRQDFFSPELGLEGVDALFSLNQTTKAAKAETGNGLMIVTMSGQKPGGTDDPAAAKSATIANNQLGSDAIVLFQRTLDEKYPVKTNDTVMNRVLATY